ncbi:MAG: PSD1 and planctomycete cytochrome C domain-containing protein [Gemmataceae bacterium]|nr:PSD1 and planctomycete cytochrome C domain-containing protein [Gemmataceae bacterium]
MTLARLAVGVILFAPAPAAAAGPDFEAEVAPVLLRRCLECHSGADPSGKLDLTTADGLAKGGRSGPAADLIAEKVAAGEMPPPKQGKPQPLPKAEADALTAWAAAGSPWPKGRTLDRDERTTESRGGRDWWAFRPVTRPVPPPGHANPIDAFVRAKLAEKGWAPAPPADPRALLRRLTFDLTGLPPTADELDVFAADPSPASYERAVDRLLASPHYGERWARHWLDVARYAETCGYERDQTKPHAWKYRDWVVAAFNADKPFGRFVREQLAGDELSDRSTATVTATGFLRLGTWNDEPNDPDEYTYERLEDLVGATTTAFLAVTVKCARCHDHKFDPVPQRDYYRLAAAFWAGPVSPGPRDLLGGPTKEQLGYDLLGWTDKSASPPPLRLLKKGDPHRPGEPVAFGFLSLVPALDKVVSAAPAEAKTTGRRLALADWITDPKNPLAARVWVNRLWQHHFGAGLVRSPDNFGFTGEKPTHPELLDWLAAEFVANGGRTKPLHRLMVLSETYKQSSVHPKQGEYAGVDAGNRLWWRAERRRLDAEQLRDALLAASGRLDLSVVGGPSFVPDISPEALEGWSRKGDEYKPSPADDQRRRTLYAFVKRGLLPPTLTAFDAPDTTLPCGKRDVTTVAPQALALLNNPLVHQQSEALAARCSGDDRVRAAWRFALGRDPRPAERAAADRHLAEQTKRLGSAGKALASLCHVLLNTNEFVYLD